MSGKETEGGQVSAPCKGHVEQRPAGVTAEPLCEMEMTQAPVCQSPHHGGAMGDPARRVHPPGTGSGKQPSGLEWVG